MNAVVPLKDLSRLKNFSLSYQRLNDHTEARRTLFGKLYVREADDPDYVTVFSKSDIKTIEQYL